MGGVDKGLQRHGGIALAELARRRLAPQVGRMAINANRNVETYRTMVADVWPDDQPDFAGPLAGIMAGLTNATTPYLAIVPCDSPYFPHDLVSRLAQAMSAHDAQIAMAFTRDGDQPQGQPVFALMRTDVRDHLAAALRRGQRKIMEWARELVLAEVLFDDASAFANVNTLGELHALSQATDRNVPLATIAKGLAGYDAKSLRVDVARAFLARIATRVDGVERVPLRAALGRVLADDVVSGIDVPPHDNAAMDGYALRHADLLPGADTSLVIVGRSLAGEPFRGTVGAAQCVRVMTGAVMPSGLDTVIPQELVSIPSRSDVTCGQVVVPAHTVRAGDHRRRAGEDLARGAIALHAGRVLKPADLGLIASLGHAQASVRRRVRVAIVTTGSELRSAGDALDAAAVYDSNRFTLGGMLERIGVEVIDLGVVRDDPQALQSLLRAGALQADAVITSGGVSVGEADHTRAAISALGEVLFWGLAMRPGRPMAIGRLTSASVPAALPTSSSPPATALATTPAPSSASPAPPSTLWFGLPGNPVAVMVTFYALVRDALLAMAGATAEPRLAWRAKSTSPIAKKPGRTEYLRGIVATSAAGDMHVRLTGAQGSGILRSMSEGNVLVVLAHESGDVAAGDLLEVWPFDGLV